MARSVERSPCRSIPTRQKSRRSSIRAFAHPVGKAGGSNEEAAKDRNQESLKGVSSMCDYSLHNVATRPAQIEDQLVTTKFKRSITRGFAAVGEPDVAVCLLPGTEIAFDENVECEPSFGIGILPNKKIGQRLARFRQINVDNPVTHHDALEFPDGQVVLLTRLCVGQRATVLQLPAGARAEAREKEVTVEAF